jgi:hypothetical protein
MSTDEETAARVRHGLESFLNAGREAGQRHVETCERCGEPAECVATVGRDWSERHCETCALLSADKGHYVHYDSGPEENA